MVLEPMFMRARGCGPVEGLLHTPSAGTHKKKDTYSARLLPHYIQNPQHFYVFNRNYGTPQATIDKSSSVACSLSSGWHRNPPPPRPPRADSRTHFNPLMLALKQPADLAVEHERTDGGNGCRLLHLPYVTKPLLQRILFLHDDKYCVRSGFPRGSANGCPPPSVHV